MKTLPKFFSVFFLLLLSAQVTSAQSQTFTVLPGTDKNYEECQEIIDNYLSTGTIPNSAEIQEFQKADQEIQDSFIALHEVQDKIQPAQNADAEFEKAYEANSCGASTPQEGQQAACSALYAKYGGTDVQSVKAQNKKNLEEAQKNLEEAQKKYADDEKKFNAIKSKISEGGVDPQTVLNEKDNLLGCGIKTGRISLAMAPYFVTYITNFALGLVGLVALFFIVLGGYYYVFGGMSDDKDKGKNTIKNALMGMAIALLAWSAVNVIMQAITG